MGIMKRLAKLDSSMQRGLDNGMAFVFGGRIVPAEIEELLKQEIQDNLNRGGDDRLYSPNVFAVGVSEKDLETSPRIPPFPPTWPTSSPALLATAGGRWPARWWSESPKSPVCGPGRCGCRPSLRTSPQSPRVSMPVSSTTRFRRIR